MSPRIAPVPLVALAMILVAACGGPKTNLRVMDAAALRQPTAWFVAFRHDNGFAIEGVPTNAGGSAAVEWSSRSEVERLFRSEVAYLLAVEHGIRIVESRDQATGVLALSVLTKVGGRGSWLEFGDQIDRADIYLMDPATEEVYAQVTVEDNPANPQKPAELARAAAAEVAAALRGGETHLQKGEPR